jgi:hypothetical protein
MTGLLRSLRRRILTPNVAETRLAVRGFHVKNEAARELLEGIGETFLAGYAYAVESRTPAEAEERLEQIPERFRGFAYEGAGMGFAVLDCATFGDLRRVTGLLSGRGGRHDYIIYVGIGWAMARLPRFLWPKSATLDPLLLWLVHDGYGFHQAYFHTERYVHQQVSETGFGWPAGQDAYAQRAIDQGIGRALWFVGGTDVERVVALIESFRASRSSAAPTCTRAPAWPPPTPAAPPTKSCWSCATRPAPTTPNSPRAAPSPPRPGFAPGSSCRTPARPPRFSAAPRRSTPPRSASRPDPTRPCRVSCPPTRSGGSA